MRERRLCCLFLPALERLGTVVDVRFRLLRIRPRPAFFARSKRALKYPGATYRGVARQVRSGKARRNRAVKGKADDLNVAGFHGQRSGEG